MKRMIDIPSAPEDGKNYSLKINNGKMTWVEDNEEPVAAGGQWYAYTKRNDATDLLSNNWVFRGSDKEGFVFYLPFDLVDTVSYQEIANKLKLLAATNTTNGILSIPAQGYTYVRSSSPFKSGTIRAIIATSKSVQIVVTTYSYNTTDGTVRIDTSLVDFPDDQYQKPAKIVLPSTFTPTQAMLASLPTTLETSKDDVEKEIK